jgi:APA family basic amino acid/polyamine antiporter
VAALFSLAGALTLAELSAASPRAGGMYVYLGEAFGAFWGFLYGWALFAVIQTAAIAAIAVAFATYCGHFLSLSGLEIQLLAACLIVVLTAINVLGVRDGVVTQNLATLAKIGLILGLIALAFVKGPGSGSGFASLSGPGSLAPFGLAAFGAALIGPLFAFDGWITTSYIGGEIKQPSRNLPLAALFSVVLVAALYLAVNAAYLHVLGSAAVAQSQLVASETAKALLGGRGADLAAVMVLIATLGSVNGCILGGARVYYAMAEDGLFWRRLASVHPRWGTPAASLIVQGAISTAFVFMGGFNQLLTYCIFASWFFYALGGTAVFVLRRKANRELPYRVWGYPWVPALFLGSTVLLLANTLWASFRDAAIGVALLLTGIPVYFYFARLRRASKVIEGG